MAWTKHLAETDNHTFILETLENKFHTKDYMDIGITNGRCSKLGLMKQFDVPGCGGRVELNCIGGCISIQKVRYSCEEIDAIIPDQFQTVKNKCENKESCKVTANRKTFGNKECPEKSENEMYLWITYRCNGQDVEDKSRKTGRRRCPKSPKELISTTPASEGNTRCFKKGLVKQLDVPGCGGQIDLECSGGCIEISKVRYSCEEKNVTIAKQFQIVKEKCQNKETC